jgi:uncharacterized hydantoinase/oxoprolinase family protein
MLCCDVCELSELELIEIARWIVYKQQTQVLAAIDQVKNHLNKVMQESSEGSLQMRKPVILLSGSGSAHGRRILDARGEQSSEDVLHLPQMFRRSVSDAACAFAVATLAHDRCRDDLLEFHGSVLFSEEKIRTVT